MSVEATDLSDDAFLAGKLNLLQPMRGYRAATDPVLLAAAVDADKNTQVLELGCGVGAASLCLGWRTGAQVTGLELQPAYAALARQNGARNGIELNVIDGDLAQMPAQLRAQSFDHVMFNPPYFTPGAGTSARDGGRETANRETTPLADWVDAALRRLKPDGWVTVIHAADRLPELLLALGNRAGSVSVVPLAARPDRIAGRVLLKARKGGRGPFRLLPPVIIHQGAEHKHDGDDFTQQLRAILRDGAPLSW